MHNLLKPNAIEITRYPSKPHRAVAVAVALVFSVSVLALAHSLRHRRPPIR